ncbi:MAG: hypothetical protein M3548_17910 [Actinomycetota bacterium]|nr:hypothetical protein [Actinomycetota bacterium]
MTTSEHDNVHYLPGPIQIPAVRADQADDSAVLEGEVLDAQEYRDLTTQRGMALERYRGYRATVVTTVRTVRTAATHRRTRMVVRHVVAYPVAGAGVVVRRWRDSHGANRYERRMRAAESSGDEDMLRYWQEADTAEKQRRHARVMDWVRAPGDLLKAIAFAIAGFAGLLLVLGVVLAIESGEFTDVLAPVTTVMDAVAFTVWFLTTYGVLVLIAGTVGVGYHLYRTGRDHADVPTWLAGTTESGPGDTMDTLPDEGTIVRALRNLNIPGFNRAMKDGWRVQFIQPPTVDGKGWRTQIALPPACPVEEIVKRKSTLAHNLVRYPIEVWPTEPSPAVLDLWVAKPGALSGPIEPWPLLADLDNTRSDYFAGVPVGVTIKGDVVKARLFEANYVLGGMMGSGKSTMAITSALGAMLDPLVDIDVVVMAENADYDPMRPRLRSLVTGAGPDTIDACMSLLTDLYEDISVRGKALREHGERANSRALAQKDSRLRPRLVIIDECQNLFMGEQGKDAIETASKVVSTARKYAITLIFLTPEPSKDAIPRKITSITSNKACYAIGDQIGNDAILGTGSYKAGISAVGLVPKTDEGPGDVGTAMVRGFTAKPGLLRTFYVNQADAHRVTDRAMELLEHHPADQNTAEVHTAPDPLADTLTVLGTDRLVRDHEVIQRLAAHNPSAYRGWTNKELGAALGDAAPYKTMGYLHVSRARVTDAITDRDENGDSEEGDE